MGTPRGRRTAPAAKTVSDAKLQVTKEIVFTVVFMGLLLVICSFNRTAFVMICCICTAFAALCFVWESKDKTDEKFFLLACALALASLGLLFYVSTNVHTDATIRSKIYQAYPDARNAYEFCRTIVENAHGWAAEEGVDIQFVKKTPWSEILN